ncbi:unnamed protein product [Camellia sinensis]
MPTLDVQTDSRNKKERRRRRTTTTTSTTKRIWMKKENRAKTEQNDLPQEILIDILLRLPIKSLVRSICVSKQWRSLIQDRAKTARRPKILVYKTHLKFSFQSIDQQCRVESVRRPWKKMLPLLADIAIIGSCNGLLLLRIESDLFLWNPLTRCSKKVLAYHRLGDAGYDVVSGLCFDSSRNEYKAVMALAHETLGDLHLPAGGNLAFTARRTPTMLIETSINSITFWSIISNESPDYGGEFMVIGSFRSKLWTHVQFPYSVRTVKPGPVLNEHLHWLASKESWGHFLSTQQIVSFDPRCDKFKKVPMPQPKDEDGDGDIILGLGALDGCLCMTRFDNPRNFEGNVEVLAMKEYGMKSSWTVMFTISNLAGVFCSYHWFVPLCSTKNNEVIMNLCVGVDDGYVTAYNPNDNSNRDILMATDNYDLNAIMYEESLVTPPDYNWEEEELGGEATYFEKYLSGSIGKRKRMRNGFWRYSELEEEEYEMFGLGLESVSKELASELEEPELELLELAEEYFQLEEEEHEEYGLESLLEELCALTSTDFPGSHIHECFAIDQPVYNKIFLHAMVIVW